MTATGQAGRPGQRGMSLVELMVALVVLAVVVAAAFGVSFSIMNSYREHRRAVNVERAARGAISVLASAVRGASPGVPDGRIVDLVGCVESWQGIRVENHSDAPDQLDLVYPLGAVDRRDDDVRVRVTSLRAPFSEASVQIAVEDASLLRPGDQVLVTNLVRGSTQAADPVRGHILAIDAVSQSGQDWLLSVRGGAPHGLCAPNPPAPFLYPVRSTLMRVQRARFWVDTDSPHLLLRMDPYGPEPPDDAAHELAVAEGIEDVQIAIGVDLDGSGVIASEDATAGDADEWVYNNGDDSPAPALAARPYRAIRLTVVARSLDEVTTTPTSRRPPAEDHPAAAALDPFRRRSLSTTVEIRNLEGSP